MLVQPLPSLFRLHFAFVSLCQASSNGLRSFSRKRTSWADRNKGCAPEPCADGEIHGIESTWKSASRVPWLQAFSMIHSHRFSAALAVDQVTSTGLNSLAHAEQIHRDIDKAHCLSKPCPKSLFFFPFWLCINLFESHWKSHDFFGLVGKGINRSPGGFSVQALVSPQSKLCRLILSDRFYLKLSFFPCYTW